MGRRVCRKNLENRGILIPKAKVLIDRVQVNSQNITQFSDLLDNELVVWKKIPKYPFRYKINCLGHK